MSKEYLFTKYACIEACSVASVMSSSFATLWTVLHQASLSMRFFRQEYWSGLPFSSPLQNISILNNHCDKVGQCDGGPSLLLLMPNIPSSFSQFSLGNHTFPTPCDLSATLFLLPKRWVCSQD